MPLRNRVVAAAATMAFCLAGCSRTAVAPSPSPLRYVATSVCDGCHAEIARSYRQTGMGRSFRVPKATDTVEDYARNNHLDHRPSARSYTMIERDGQWFQRRHQTGFEGQEANVVETRVNYIIGSGNHARSYLHRAANGRLIEMPVSWYSENGGYWAMSPGYDRPNQQDFRRAIAFSCMFCHNAYPDSAAAEEGVFPSVLPEGIDCQRCHGPGSAHVDAAGRQAPPETIRSAIVNPKRLPRDRQLDVCMQCHLETTSRPLPGAVARFEHGPFDYQSGQPLTDYFLYFDRASSPALDDSFEIAHAAYRLRKSKCFLASEMTCTTCHNPHNAPRGPEAAARYNAACRQCHPGTHADNVKSSGDCVSCHMPKRRTGDAVHVVMTDHYIQRQRPARNLLAARAEAVDSGYRGEVVPYYPQTGADELYVAVAQVRDGTNLEMGIPRLRQAIELRKPAQPEFSLELAKAYSKAGNAQEAVRWCEEALRSRPGFAPALNELGGALIQAGDFKRAAETLRQTNSPAARTNLGNAYLRLGNIDLAEQALRAATDDPDSNNLLGMAESAKNNYGAAEQFFRKAIELQTDHAEAHHNLANLLAARRDYAQSAYHFQQAIAANPAYAEAHYRFGVLLLATGAVDHAQHEIEAALRLAPGLAEAHRDLADILAAKGRSREAAAEYRLAEKDKP